MKLSFFFVVVVSSISILRCCFMVSCSVLSIPQLEFQFQTAAFCYAVFSFFFPFLF